MLYEVQAGPQEEASADTLVEDGLLDELQGGELISQDKKVEDL